MGAHRAPSRPPIRSTSPRSSSTASPPSCTHHSPRRRPPLWRRRPGPLSRLLGRFLVGTAMDERPGGGADRPGDRLHRRSDRAAGRVRAAARRHGRGPREPGRRPHPLREPLAHDGPPARRERGLHLDGGDLRGRDAGDAARQRRVAPIISLSTTRPRPSTPSATGSTRPSSRASSYSISVPGTRRLALTADSPPCTDGSDTDPRTPSPFRNVRRRRRDDFVNLLHRHSRTLPRNMRFELRHPLRSFIHGGPLFRASSDVQRRSQTL